MMEAHQLPKECYPPTDSDDDSFEVLETASTAGERRKEDEDFVPDLKSQLLPTEDLDQALDVANDVMLSAMTLQSLPQMPQLQMHESFMSTSSVGTSVSSKLYLELQDKIKDLKEENALLRTTLAQQNLVTKNHSDILTTWKEDVVRVHQSHKLKFEKMKALIEQLKKENKQLKQMLASSTLADNNAEGTQSAVTSSLIQKHEQQVKELLEAKHAKEIQDKADELEQAKSELEQTKAKFADSTIELLRVKEELEKVQQQSMVIVQQAQETNTEHQDHLDKLLAEKEEQHKKIINLLEEEKNALERQLKEAKEVHHDEKCCLEASFEQEISALKAQLSGNESQAASGLQALLQQARHDLGETKELNEQQALRIADLKAKLAQLSDVHDMLSGEFIATKQQFSESRDTLSEKSNEVLLLQEQLEGSRREIVALKASVEGKLYLEEQLADYKKQVKINDEEYVRVEAENQEAGRREQKLQEEIMALKCQVLKMKNEGMAEMQKLRIQLSEAQNTIVEVKERKKAAEAEAAENRKAMDNVMRLYGAAKCDLDKVCALEEQAILFKKDYKAERESKLYVVEELNKVSQDLENVQLRNRELVEEIERLRAAQDFVNVPPPQQSNNSPSPPPTNFKCPLCNSSFRSLRLVQEHVEMCINHQS